MIEEYNGILREIIFHNNENGYTVAVFETEVGGSEAEGGAPEESGNLEAEGAAPDGEEFSDIFTIVGNIPMATAGKSYTIRGEFVEHPVYGEQFKVKEFADRMPSTREGIREFLASGALKGIGQKTAAALVATFGEDTFRIIEEEPEKLTRVSGIGKKTAKRISVAFAEQRGFARVSLELQQYGIGGAYALRLYSVYGADVMRILEENPYRLIDDFYGIGFVKADRIAEKNGMKKDDPFRIMSGIRYTLSYFAGEGNTYMPEDRLCEEAVKILDVPMDLIRDKIEAMVFKELLQVEMIDGQRVVYLIAFYMAEQRVSKHLRLLKNAALKRIAGSPSQLIKRTEAATGILLSENQKHAVETSLDMGVSVITGGPGTGKTTIINSIIEIFEDSGLVTMIAAPTGRAAKRITETSGHQASTIHRLLEYSYSEGEDAMRFGRNENNPLECDAVIVDEASMIDLMLMDALVRAISPGTRLIIVGDDDQLPSVGPGNVLRDIIQSEYIYCTRLTEIFRQARESMIVVNAHRINKGEYPDCNAKGKDFFLLRRNNENEMQTTIRELCLKRLPDYYEEISPVRDIQVLTPVRKGNLGTLSLNVQLQEILNPAGSDKEEKLYGDRLFREGDKVMQIRNNYELKWKDLQAEDEGEGIFNGDVGFITSINKEDGKLTVVFDGSRFVTYQFSQLDELELAYAVTVHKSQGSEFPIVILPVSWFPPVLATRNLLYTAVTRGKMAVVLVGSENKLHGMVDNNRISQRFSGLRHRLGGLLKLEMEGLAGPGI